MRLTTAENFNMAMDAVWTNRFRSGLTILGIVIGITTVVTVSSLLTGLRQGIVTFFEEFGPDNIFVSRFTGDPNQPPRPKEAKRRPIRPEYADLVKRYCRSVDDVSIALIVPGNVGGQPLTAKVPGFESDNVRMGAATANSWSIQPRDMKAGRVFTQDEANRAAKVGVIGPSLANALFPDGNAVGKAMVVGGAEYLVVGVLTEAKGGFFGENPQDYQITIPLETARLRYPQLDNFLLTIRAVKGQRDSAFEEAQAVIRKVRRLAAADPDDFQISTADQIIKNFDQLIGVIVLVSVALSGLGLLVGGIGVMNIMLVSVTERTREIGVRKAIGARRSDIVLQFLMEAVTLTGLGGVVGIVLSVGVTFLVGVLVPSLPSSVPAWAVGTGFGVSVAVGVFFGVWPAFKASRLDPVEALRYE